MQGISWLVERLVDGQRFCSIDGEAGSSVELVTKLSGHVGLCKILVKFNVRSLSEFDYRFLSNPPLLYVTFISGCRVAVLLALAVGALG